MNNKTKSLVLSGAAVALATPMSSALALDDVLSFGAWVNYTYNVDNDASEDRLGDIDFPAFIIYANHEHGDWFFDSELRYGSGSFQDFSGPNNEGDVQQSWGFKELAFGRHYGEEWTMTLGLTDVPFTTSRINFWPGERMTSGFGDQENVGIRFDHQPVNAAWDMSLMFAKSQNWGTDTTSQDDGTLAHWGKNENPYMEYDEDTYHKINTLIGDFGVTQGDFRHGVSVQAGQLADIDDPSETETHFALGVYTEGSVGDLDVQGQFVHYDQGDVNDLSNDYDTQGAGQVGSLGIGSAFGNWYTYGDLSARFPDSDRVNDDTQMDLVLGASYDYGPGWIYPEILLENITDEEDGAGGSDEFSQTISLTMDYYF